MSATPHMSTICLFLFLSRAIGEWVEIEQNNYKPPRTVSTNREHVRTAKPHYEETTKNNRIYRNHSINEQWNKGVVDRVTNVGNIRRVHVPAVKTTAIKSNPDMYNKHVPSIVNGDDRSNYRDDMLSPKGDYFFDITSKSKFKPNSEEDFSIKVDKVTEQNIINSGTKFGSDNPKDSSNLHRKVLHDEEEIITFNKPNRNKIYQSQVVKNHPMRNEQVVNDHMNYERINIRQDWTSKRPSLHSTQSSRRIINPIKEDNQDYKISSINTHEDVNYTKYPNMSKFKSHINKIESAQLDNNAVNYKTNIKFNNAPEEFKEETINDEDVIVSNAEDLSNSTKAGAVNGIWKLVKVVSDTIYKNTHRSFRSKVKYLERMKATILTTIEDNIESIWPDDAEHRSRRAREARGHLEFPSSESSLMTISFLTFAVFLIKLVLQVIHTYKNKTMMVTPTVVAAVGRAAQILRSRH